MASLQHSILRIALTGTSIIVPNKNLNLKLLREMIDLGTVWTFLPWGVKSEKFQIDYLACEWIVPISKNKKKAILYLHGGGYAIGSNVTHRAMVGRIVKETHTPALLINYRKIPEHPCPAAIEDAFLAYQWLLDKGYKSEDIVVAGDSAGGGLSIALMYMLREHGYKLPSGLVCLSPWVDLEMKGESLERNRFKDPFVKDKEMARWAKVYAGEHPMNSPLVSPLHGDLKGFPPMLIQTSYDEILYSGSINLYKKAKEEGVEVELQEWKGLIHWWHLFWRVIPEGETAILKVADFINKVQ